MHWALSDCSIALWSLWVLSDCSLTSKDEDWLLLTAFLELLSGPKISISRAASHLILLGLRLQRTTTILSCISASGMNFTRPEITVLNKLNKRFVTLLLVRNDMILFTNDQVVFYWVSLVSTCRRNIISLGRRSQIIFQTCSGRWWQKGLLQTLRLFVKTTRTSKLTGIF